MQEDCQIGRDMNEQGFERAITGHQLTDRQKTVAWLTWYGYSRQEIAESMGLSKRSIRREQQQVKQIIQNRLARNGL